MRMIILVAALLVVTVATAGNPPDPRPTKVVATGPGPCGVASRAGTIWVGVYGTGDLLAIDARTGVVQSRTRVGRWACAVAAGPAAVWVARDRAGELVRVSRRNGRVARTDVATGTYDVLLAHGSVWTTSFDHAVVVRTRPSTLRLERLYEHGSHPTGLASCAGRVWVGYGRATTWVTSIDPLTHRMRRIDVGATAPRSPECIHGVVWVTTLDSVIRIEPESGRILSRLHLGETLAKAAAGPDGLVWVTDKQNSIVYRLTPDGERVVDSFPAGPGAFALARAGDSMWITSFAGTDVRRFDR